MLSEKQKKYLYSEENIERLRRNRKNQKVSPFKGHTWKGKEHPRGMLGKKNPSRARLNRLQTKEKNPMYGIRLEKNVERMKNNNPMKNPETARKVHEKNRVFMKEKMKDPKKREAFVKRIRSGLKKPTKPERAMMQIIKDNNLPFNYVGNGNIWFKGHSKMFNPDFLSKNPKHIIEVFGDYWHNIPKRKSLDVLRLSTYKRYGYKTLVIWESELIQNKKPIKNPTQVIEKINKFVGGD